MVVVYEIGPLFPLLGNSFIVAYTSAPELARSIEVDYDELDLAMVTTGAVRIGIKDEDLRVTSIWPSLLGSVGGVVGATVRELLQWELPGVPLYTIHKVRDLHFVPSRG